jgi:Holliday junction resolvase RusA-like endonuclease
MISAGAAYSTTDAPAPAEAPTLPLGTDTVLARLRVYGIPSPAGSKVAFTDRHSGQARLKEQNATGHRAWSQAVAGEARQTAERLAGHAPLDGPLVLEATFRFPVPATRRKAATRVGGTLPKTSAPDTSKLVRSIEDAMQAAGLIVNDARFATLFATKLEVLDGWHGVEITIRRPI